MAQGNDRLTEQIIGCCFSVHKELGPGFPEKAYHRALEHALAASRLAFLSEKQFRVTFRGAPVATFRVDVLVEDTVVVEIKALMGMMPRIHEAQMLSYLKAAQMPVGLLVNFGNASCQVRRLVLRTSPKSCS